MKIIFKFPLRRHVSKVKKTLVSALLLALALSLICTGCGKEPTVKDDTFTIITSSFPSFDFARNIAGDRAEVKMLLSPGQEAHGYEPSPKDIIAIRNCDLFIYNGGENEVWVEKLIEDIPGLSAMKMTDCVPLLREEISEGMQTHDHEEDEESHEGDSEFEEHVWLSPKNALLICEAIKNRLCDADPEGTEKYLENFASYSEELKKLDGLFTEVVRTSPGKTIVVGDRFPFLYLVREYGLNYYAAFPGCASDTEPGAKTVAFLIEKVRQENIPIVFFIEFSNGKTARAIASESGAETALLHSCHNVTKDEFESGASYLTLMRANAEALRKALERK